MIRSVLLTLALLAAHSAFGQSEPEQFFEKKIRPVLVKSCQGCHNAKIKTAELDLSTPAGLASGGQSGPLFSKEAPKTSLLLRVLHYDERIKMPPAGKLKPEELADFETWIAAGSPLPGSPAGGVAVRKPAQNRGFTEEEMQFWAFQKIADPKPPAVKNESWIKAPIDRFVLAKLEDQGLTPNAPADKPTLLRRVTFDLTGLPPTEKEIASFLADDSPTAFSKVVDRLLDSPRYGERWGRHWLDVARYADSTGNDEDHRYPYAWRYRDYVIDSFNRDVPFNQFIREQIAGDLLPPDKPGSVNARGIVATGFLALGAKAVAQQDKKKMLVDIYDEQIDVVTKGFLGVTLSCARCHDHKFDPLLTKDYYSMLTIFANTRNFKVSDNHVSGLLFRPLVPEEEFQRFTKGREIADQKLGEIEDVLEDRILAYSAELAPRVADYMMATRKGGKTAGLDGNILKKWAEYLTPSKEPKAHLSDWHNATAENAPAIAARYQSEYEAERAEWAGKMESTRKVRRQRMRSMPPKLGDAVEKPFFYEVHFEGPFAVPADEREKLLPAGGKALVARLKSELKEIEASLPPEPEMACAVGEGKEGGVVSGKVFIRGDYNSLGEDAPKAFPTILTHGNQPGPIEGSGRLELASWLASPENVMTPRVFVNRAWYWHFGEGIVRTPDNFGRMGEKPTHPELLDYLSSRFIESGWSVKSLHRQILLSNSYQMSSRTTEEAAAKDPENALFSRFPRRRLSVEEMRDGMLALDGTLDLKMGGSLQSGFGTDGENSNDRLSMKPETVKRRMVYLPLRRANLPTLLNLFDFGDATSSASKRTSTTIAPQALFLMNSDFMAERARNLAADAVKDGNPSSRLKQLYLRILNRPPKPEEVDSELTFVANFTKRFSGKRTEDDAWFSLSRILLASNEYIYLD